MAANVSHDEPYALKRKRSASLPPTPPVSMNDPEGSRRLDRAVNVLTTAATALSRLALLYQTDPTTRDAFLLAVERLVKVQDAGGKLIICGVGKSGLIGKKTVATMKSLGLACSFLHASEALHGDLGDVRKSDAILFISYSAKTPELLTLLHHIPRETPVLAITSHTNPSDCRLLAERLDGILLPAPIHELEEVSFGVCAPTTSTTVATAVGDMLALSVAEAMHQEQMRHVFRVNHPGGAIGAHHTNQRKTDTTEEDSSAKRAKVH